MHESTSKTTKHTLEQEKESSKKKVNEGLLEKEEENLCLKTFIQKLIEQTKDLKNKKVEHQNTKRIHLMNHNQR